MRLLDPLVSVIAVCYNHSKFLKFTLDSIRNQTYNNIEVLVIDSFSSDDSLALIYDYIREFNLKDWKVVVQKKKTSICENLNFALSVISGDFYQVISCDDIILPNKISNQISYLLSSEIEYSLIYGDYSFIDENSNLISNETLILRKNNYSESNPPPSGMVFCELIGNWFILSITCLIRTDSANFIGGYDEDLSFEDTDFFLRISKEFPIAGLLTEVAYYRILSNSFYNTRSIEFYVSSCKLYLKHIEVSSCQMKIKTWASHYLDVVFSLDSKVALNLFDRYPFRFFRLYLVFYFLIYKISGNYKLSLVFKNKFSKFLKKWN